MTWLNEALSQLAQRTLCGYCTDSAPAVEPTALSAMALMAHGRRASAAEALEWLAGIQAPDGTLGVSATVSRPCWATGWALLAWRRACCLCEPGSTIPPAGNGNRSPGASRWETPIDRAAAWILLFRGRPVRSSPELGHDATLEAWPWVEGTHSWVEPTAINLLALKAAGYAEHARCRDGVRLLCDRATAAGGWNYGNPQVFGARLSAHVQPTGLALAALAGEDSAAREIQLGVAYLRRTVSPDMAAASLSYALIGLAAHGQIVHEAPVWLGRAARRTLEEGAAPYALALLSLAATGRSCPWFTPPSRPVSDRAAAPTEGLRCARTKP